MTWSNYDDVLRQMRERGLVVERRLDTDRMYRCSVEGEGKEKRGWYRLHEWVRRNTDDSVDVLLIGSFGWFKGADRDSNRWKVELPKPSASQRKMTADELAAYKARIAEDRRQAEAHRAREAQRAAQRAQAMWLKCEPTGTSGYLERKRVGAHGVRFTAAGSVVVPMLDIQGRINGLQFILPPGHKRREQLGRDKTFWPAGATKQGTHFALGAPASGGIILIAEGYATAATLFEATGLPTIVAFDAGNLLHVAQAIHARYRRARILVCADDDYLTDGNPGVTAAEAAALAVGGASCAPAFTVDRQGKKLTDFNDLQQLEGLHVVRNQVEARIRQLGWNVIALARPSPAQGGGDDEPPDDTLRKIDDPSELFERFVLVYDMPEAVFDEQEHQLVPLSSMRNLCTSRHHHRQWMESSAARVVRQREVGFDPAGTDPEIKCNLWAGWPTTPVQGSCETLLDLLHYLCSAEKNADALYQWVLKWLAYPIQHPGAKMRTALVLHGPQGTGKNMFFEAYMAVFGMYGRIIDQAAVEDKFNDWASRKLFLIADEVVARLELYHTKNKLKSLITGEWIRINPKNMGAHDERNHVNMVFLSNETQPLVLERDDRRYTVIWTPPKQDMAFYETVRQEINAGGIAALHHHLLHLELGDFAPWTQPPMTSAKADLIDLSMDSTERFWMEWIAHLLPLPITAARSEDLYDAYRHWCHRNGVQKPAQLATFVGNCAKRPGAAKARRYHFKAVGSTADAQSMIVWPPNADPAADKALLTEQVLHFAECVNDWRDVRNQERVSA